MSRVAERAVPWDRSEPAGDGPVLDDQRVLLHGRGWADYEALLAMRGERAVPRITYLEREIELLTPGLLHEYDRTKLARILEAWADATGQFLDGFGSWTLKLKKEERGGEPDECYVVSERPKSRLRRPDLAIEVVRTSGGLPKLEVYRKLGVGEVWFWIDGELRFFELRRGARYVERERSALLPALDPALVARAMRAKSQPAAVRLVRAALRRQPRR